MEVVRSVARVDAIQLHRSEARCVRYSSRGEFIQRKMIEDNEPQGGHRNFLYWIWSTFVVWHDQVQFNCTVPKLVACAIRQTAAKMPKSGMHENTRN